MELNKETIVNLEESSGDEVKSDDILETMKCETGSGVCEKLRFLARWDYNRLGW